MSISSSQARADAGEQQRAPPHRETCANCDASLVGPWCHACGQKGEDFHRSIWHLAAEAFEGLTHFDGRIWNTLPRLAIRPGRLTRDYLDGRRASQIPPFRMFLVVLLAVFLAGGLSFRPHVGDGHELSASDRAQVEEAIGAATLDPSGIAAWVKAQAIRATHNPEPFVAALEHWAHRFAILMLPVAAALLGLLFLGRAGVYLFDHMIFAMHSLSFQGLLLSIAFLIGPIVGGGEWLLLASPVHLFVHMRGTYGTGVAGTLVRMALLFVGSVVGFGLLMAGLLVVGLAAVH